MPEPMKKERALQVLAKALFCKSNLIGSDFKRASAVDVNIEFPQGSGGVFIQFAVSHHALGKVITEEVSEALKVLSNEGE